MFNLNLILNDAPQPWQIGFQDSAAPGFSGIVELHNFILILIILFLYYFYSTSYSLNLIEFSLLLSKRSLDSQDDFPNKRLKGESTSDNESEKSKEATPALTPDSSTHSETNSEMEDSSDLVSDTSILARELNNPNLTDEERISILNRVINSALDYQEMEGGSASDFLFGTAVENRSALETLGEFLGDEAYMTEEVYFGENNNVPQDGDNLSQDGDSSSQNDSNSSNGPASPGGFSDGGPSVGSSPTNGEGSPPAGGGSESNFSILENLWFLLLSILNTLGDQFEIIINLLFNNLN